MIMNIYVKTIKLDWYDKVQHLGHFFQLYGNINYSTDIAHKRSVVTVDGFEME